MTIALWYLALACGTSEENFGDQAAGAYCDFAKRCETYSFYQEWNDKDDCFGDEKDAYDNFYDNVIEELDCEFDEEKAQGCLSGFNASCEAAATDDHTFDDCDEVWDCGQGGGGGDFFHWD